MGNASQIHVELLSNDNPMTFSVVVVEGGGKSQHRVTVDRALFQQLSAGRATPEGLIQAAFLFLLDREPKESILSRFDITVIAKYFPEFPKKIGNYL